MKTLFFLISSILTVLAEQSQLPSIKNSATEQFLEKNILSSSKTPPQDLHPKQIAHILQQVIEEYLTKKSKLEIKSTWLKFIPDLNRTYPESFDWRERGAVSPIKSQGACASDWAFSAIGAIEGQIFRKTGKLVELSVQNILDCSKNFSNDGCGGGFIHKTFEYVKSAGGVDTEASYPYEGRDGACRFKSDKIGATVKGYVYIGKGDEKALEAAVVTVGPIAVGLAVGSAAMFRNYTNGVYYDPKCGNNSEDLSLGALVVGYGREESGEKYWLVKNSLGKKWGIDGYMKIAKDSDNHCGVATYASFPLV